MITERYFLYFSFKPYVVTPHLNHLIETVQMRGHNIRFYAELKKIIPNYQQILLIQSSGTLLLNYHSQDGFPYLGLLRQKALSYYIAEQDLHKKG